MTRPPDRHLDGDELAALVFSDAFDVTATGVHLEETIRETLRHIESCRDCDQKLQMHRSVQKGLLSLKNGQTGKGPNCSDEDEWQKVAAGLVGKKEASERMMHAAQCGNCGPLLKAATEALSEESSATEETLLSSLTSARRDWQTQMAQTLKLEAEPRTGFQSSPSFWKAVFYWPRIAVVTAGLVVLAAAGWLGMRSLHHASPEQLLARAYTERRTIDVRIRGAEYAPLRVERGGADSNLDKPESLLRAEALIGENLRLNAKDPKWLGAKARADLLDGNYESAIRTLRQALDIKPGDPQLLTDLGSAYFVRAESLDHASDYGNALESLGEALAKLPDDPVLLFNRAIVSERLFLYNEALADWGHYLRIDPVGHWADEAKKRMEEVRQKKNQERSENPQSLSPTQFANQFSVGTQTSLGEIDVRIEDYLDAAILGWLPTAYSTNTEYGHGGEARQALDALSAILATNHQDLWLNDFLNVTRPPDADAVDALSGALEANLEGNPSLGLFKAMKAANLFHRQDNVPGQLRAKMEEVYSLQRLFRGHDCLALANQITNDARNRHYTWIEAQLKLEQYSCTSEQGKMDRGHRFLAEAFQLAGKGNYRALRLRAVAFEANLEADKGNFSASADWSRVGLSNYWTGTYSPLRAYQFYDNLSSIGQSTGRWQLARSAQSEAVLSISKTANRSGEGIARMELAIASAMTGDQQAAKAEYEKAHDIFSRLKSKGDVRGFEADAELQLAEAEASQGEIDVAALRVARAKEELPSGFDSYSTWFTYFNAEASIARQSGDVSNLRTACSAVAGMGELVLSSIRTPKDRMSWNRTASRCYRDLVGIKLRDGDPSGALEIWEEYQGASTRSRSALPEGRIGHLRPHAQPLKFADFRRALSALDGYTVLAYAEADGNTVAWAFDDRGIFWHLISADSVRISRTAAEFAQQCADPHSDTTALRANGRLLYEWLIVPFASRVDNSRTIVVEADDKLALIPFQALVEPDGEYLGLRHTVVYSPGLAFMDRLKSIRTVSRDMTALVVGSPFGGPGGAVLPEAMREAESISQLFTGPILLQGRGATQETILEKLPSAEIFHFAGHAFATSEGTGLEVSASEGDGAELPKTLLAPDVIAPSKLRNLQLVVLSACSTGRPGAYGLADPENIAAAFLRAGVPQVVASRWNVDSLSTQTLMVKFYAFLLEGMTSPESLRRAAASLRGVVGTSHPYYWASFAVYGR